MEFKIDIGPFTLFKRTQYSKFQVSTKDGTIVTNTSTGKRLLEDYEKQISFPENYFDIDCGILNNFDKDRNLAYVFVPKNTTHIPHSTFADSNINYINLPDNLFFLGPSAFKDCYNLGEIKIPPLIKRIEENTFEGCLNLKSIELPDTLLMIEQFAFSGCLELNKVHIPDTVRKIDNYAFSGCTCIKEINIPRDFENFGYMPFLNSGIETIHFSYNLSRRNPLEYKDALKYTKIDKVIIDDSVQFLDFKILEPIKEQIKEIKYNGSFESLKSFIVKNSAFATDFPGVKITSIEDNCENTVDRKDTLKTCTKESIERYGEYDGGREENW